MQKINIPSYSNINEEVKGHDFDSKMQKLYPSWPDLDDAKKAYYLYQMVAKHGNKSILDKALMDLATPVVNKMIKKTAKLLLK